ncbi:MAG: esterase family protein, partial [Pantoea sp.]|nr:esterase family protein [Pantoea sp.]
MKIICFAPLLFALGCPVFAADPLPAPPPQDLPVSAWQTRVNAARSISWRLYAPQAKAVSVVTGATA